MPYLESENLKMSKKDLFEFYEGRLNAVCLFFFLKSGGLREAQSLPGGRVGGAELPPILFQRINSPLNPP